MDCPPGQWPLHVKRWPLVEVRLHFKAMESSFICLLITKPESTYRDSGVTQGR